MKNSEFIKKVEDKMKGNLLKSSIYTFLFMIIINLFCFMVNLIPIVGIIISIIIIVPMNFGFEKMMMLLLNGEKIKFFDFVKHGFENFLKVWHTGLLLILEFLLPVTLLILGSVLLNMPNWLWIGAIILFVAIMIYIVFYLRYTLISYELAYNPDKKPKELIEGARNNIEGNIGRYIYIILYYTAILLLEMFLLAIIVLISSAYIVSSPTYYTTIGKIGLQLMNLNL